MSEEHYDYGPQPIGGPRLHERTVARGRRHSTQCIDPEDGSLDCVCGLTDYLDEKAESDLARHEERDQAPEPPE